MKLISLLLPISASLLAAETPTVPSADKAASFSEENLQFDFAMGLLRRNLYPEAATEFTKFLAEHGQSARRWDARRYRGEAAYGKRDYTAAAADYLAYFQATGSADLTLRLRYAICLYELKRPAECRKTLEPLLPLLAAEENRALVPDVNYYLAMAIRESGDLTAAARYFKTVTDIPVSSAYTPLALYALGEIYRGQSQYGMAAECFSRLAKDFPGHELASGARLAESDCLRQGGLIAQAVAKFQGLLDSPDPVIRARARYGLAGALVENGRPADAIPHAQAVLQDSAAASFHDGAHNLLATVYFGRGDYRRALSESSAVKPQSEFSENAAVTFAWSQYRLRQFTEALASAAAGTQKYPDNEDFPYLAGRVCWELHQYPEAAEHFLATRDRALRTHGKRAESATLEAALSLEKASRPAEAIPVYEWLRRHFPNGAQATDARFGLGRALMAAGRNEAALPLWENLTQDMELSPDKRASALFQQATAYYYLKQFNNLRLSCERLLGDFPQSQNAPDALYWLAWRDMEDKQYPQALNRYRDFVKRYPRHRLTPKARYYTGAALLKLNREDEAAEVFYGIVKDGEKLEGRELLWLASRLTDTRRPQQAEEVYSRVLEQSQEPLLRVIALLGRAKLRRAAQNWNEALNDSQAVLDLLLQLDAKIAVKSPLTNEAYFGKAVALRSCGRFAMAEEALNLVHVAPDDPFTAQLHYERGMLAFAQEKYAEAGELLLRVGLLVNDEELAGSSLWQAAEACMRNHDPARARICYDELAGKTPGSFGTQHPQNPYRQRALEALKRLAPAPGKNQPK